MGKFITKAETVYYTLMKGFEKKLKNCITMQLKIIYQNFLQGYTVKKTLCTSTQVILGW